MVLHIPTSLQKRRDVPGLRDWIERLPAIVQQLCERWELRLADPFDSEEVSAAWVAPAVRRGDLPAVLKVGLPHMESRDEAAGLRFWAGAGAVRLLAADDALDALLIERCVPGNHLRELPEEQQDGPIAGLLRRLWRVPPVPHPFRHLSEMATLWATSARAQADRHADSGLIREGADLFEDLAANAPHEALLVTDLHAGNVLRATREPWLAIDPKPFVGDIAYDATQHLGNCLDRMAADPAGTVDHFADRLDLDRARVRWWAFARAATSLVFETADPRQRTIAVALVPS